MTPHDSQWVDRNKAVDLLLEHGLTELAELLRGNSVVVPLSDDEWKAMIEACFLSGRTPVEFCRDAINKQAAGSKRAMSVQVSPEPQRSGWAPVWEDYFK